MAIKTTPTVISRKKTTKPVATPKMQSPKANNLEGTDIRKIVDLQAQQIIQLNKTVSSLQDELKDIKGLIHSNERTGTEKKPVVSPKTTVPVKTKTSGQKTQTPKKSLAAVPKTAAVKPPAKSSKPLPVQEKESKAVAKKAVTSIKSKAKTPVPKEINEPVSVPVKRGRKLVQNVSSDAPVAIPSNFADRINALTAKKKITQTQFGLEVDLPQKVIYDLSERKVKTLSLEKIQKITTVLKKYESK